MKANPIQYQLEITTRELTIILELMNKAFCTLADELEFFYGDLEEELNVFTDLCAVLNQENYLKHKTSIIEQIRAQRKN